MIQKSLFGFILAGLPVFFSIIFLPGCTSRGRDQKTGAGRDWPVYLGDNYSSQYSTLTEINRENIYLLEPAWEYITGDDVSENRSQIQCNPVIIDGILYGTSPRLKVFALNAATGERLWEFDPDPESRSARNVNRGISYWQDGPDKRLLFTSGPDLLALDAETGRLIETFGKSGKISLKEGLGDRAHDLYVVATSPGIVYDELLIIGSRVSENAGAAPGYIRSYNIKTGKLAWVFNTIPKPGEYGYDTWPDGAWQTAGGANAWAGMSLDKSRGIVYVPTGSAAFDFWGGNRKGANLFANCILALNARTGERIWHFQTVHHDIWDRDLPSPPNLLTVTINGKRTDALAQVTKSGYVYLLDRETGEPLFPVEERPVPGSDLKGEETWPVQPFPVTPPPFVPQLFTENEITNISQASHDYVSGIVSGLRTGEHFIPPGTRGTVIFPGFDGGGEWGGAAVDPTRSVLYVNGNIMPWILQMIEISKDDTGFSGAGEFVYKVNCAVCHGTDLRGDPTGTNPDLRPVPGKYNKNDLLVLINEGKGTMPSFKQLKQDEKDALAAFMLGLQDKRHEPVQDRENDPVPVPYTHTGYNRFLDQDGYPAVKPPWGTISAIDLNNGTLLWQVPLGEYEELTERGIPKTGTENYGGPVVTAGGLLFIGASKDEYFRAFDKDTGAELWKYKLPAGGYATPGVYEANGKQYVVIACGGGKMGTKSGDRYVAFTLGKPR
ncbi:MAG TPA: PQQ-binding-like beta-propeller repeat protein [Bacteroidales bacterium]|nr:PQQ-binding-like beta-propeller repeat protein [Bacteroidales bacterium]